MMDDFVKSYDLLCKLFDAVAEGKEDISKLIDMEKSLPFTFDEFCEANDFVEADSWQDAIAEYLKQISNGERVFLERV